MRATGAFFLLAMASVQCLAQVNDSEINLLAYANGAVLESATSNAKNDWDAYWLIDGESKKGWATERGASGPFEAVISLPERSEIRRFEFDTASVESPDRAAKQVDIFVSENPATSGFIQVMSADLAPDQDGQSFALSVPVAARYVKFIVRSNHGSDVFTEIMEARAYGVELTDTPMPNLSGTYEASDFGSKFHLQQDGAQVAGCYEYNGGLVQGGIEKHIVRLSWSESSGNRGSGPAIMVVGREPGKLKGLWRYNDTDRWRLNWDLKKISDDIGSCDHWSPSGANQNIVATSLATAGRVRLYGINFDIDRDVIRADARPTLDQLATALNANSAWNVMIEGHTDATGTPEHNIDLSNRRAASVRAYLVAAGVAAERLAS